MKKIIYSKYDKKAIASLPVVAFGGRIITVLSPGETDRAVDFLLSHDILGVDTETRPSFTKGHQYTVSLLQVATHDTCFLFRLKHTGITPAILRLLEDTTVPKIGLSWHDDIHSLSRRATFKPGYFIELQKAVGEIGIQDLSLQKLYANLFGQKINKREQLSNWERSILTEKQKLYAATDAWACIMLYEELLRLERTGDYELIEVCDEEATGV
ncbi:MAG: 3'-5' exonuclease domain-containing protein 2 [Prevotella sp.]|nr:3'-5' exonuclease domain-containing protein 2 [Prevotella sp.]